MAQYVIYLRKSRTDADLEIQENVDILQRHEAALLSLAKQNKLDIVKIFKEVVSGDSISARPKMQELLTEIEQSLYSGVLVMDIDRLARGDTIDQGLVAQAFRYSGTKIITPMKTYDPENEFDEEYFEFGLFMSRREYKIINRRLQRGRLASVMEGKYVANKAPYGYKRVKLPNEKGFTLEIIPEQAEVIRLIYDMYVNGEIQKSGDNRRMGSYLISRRLNDMKIPSYTNNGWTQASIRDILINPVYIGKIRWNWRKNVRQVVNGTMVKTRPRQSLADCQLVDGLHQPIIAEDVWNEAQRITSSNSTPRTPSKHVTQNPLSGLIVCGKCGRRMSRRPDSRGKTPPSLICAVTSCNNVSSYLHYVEEKVLAALVLWLEEYKIKMRLNEKDSTVQVESKSRAVKALKEDLANIEKQMNNLHNLLEQGVYDTETFLHRSKLLADRRVETAALLEEAQVDAHVEMLREKSKIEIIPKVENLLAVYDTLPTALQKNQMLKEVLEKVVYTKETGGRWRNSPDDFTIVLYPRIQSDTNHR